MEQNPFTYAELFRNIIAVVILLPAFWYLMRNQQKQNENILSILDKRLENIAEAFKAHDAEDQIHFQEIKRHIQDEAIRTRIGIGNTVLSERQAVSMLLEKMWFVSLQKLDFIRTQLKACSNVNTEEDRALIRRRVQTELERKSQIYMNDFQEFITPVGTLDDWLNKNFNNDDFAGLLDKIYKIMFRAKRKELTDKQCADVKIDEIGGEMRHLQNTLATKLKIDLKIFK